MEDHERRLKSSKEARDRAGEGIAYCNLRNVYDRLGAFQKAIEYHERHVKISKEVGDTYRLISLHQVLYINKYIYYTSIL